MSRGIGAKKGAAVERDWRRAEEKRGPCRNCGDPYSELAHIAGREHDFTPAIGFEDMPLVRSRLFVAPTRVIPLCGPPTDHVSCHGKAHRGELDWLRLLETDEQVQAVADFGSIALAFRALTPRGVDGL